INHHRLIQYLSVIHQKLPGSHSRQLGVSLKEDVENTPERCRGFVLLRLAKAYEADMYLRDIHTVEMVNNESDTEKPDSESVRSVRALSSSGSQT
ncbi:MAG: hypothetical protein AAFW89_10550, partial [Bacteroidota bacterium]